nr:LPP20 family lipoprotein [Paracoccaceae bacterium]
MLTACCILLLWACGGTKELTETVTDTTPTWVKEHPVSADYYIGIGIADKSTHPTNYIQIAQQNSLQNLASQIKVTIATQSVFIQMEREYGFEEEFKSDIQIKAQEHLEGYEQMGSHTESNSYWVYYRLSKTKYAEVRQARME